MNLKSIELTGFKSFAKKSVLEFKSPVTAVVGPNGSGKSNVAEAFRFVLGEQSIKSLRGKRGEDLIWNGSADSPRAGRAAVKVIFDNSGKIFDLDFPEVAIERVVNRDGTNDYSLNGSSVRLKDIFELLSGAHIASSGHHIISQGEADKVLNASPKERKAIIEDALGLKLYQYKRAESEKKLEKTRENIVQVGALRREIAPHLRFLKRQMDKLEKSEADRRELIRLGKGYFRDEERYVAEAKKLSSDEKSPITGKLAELARELAEAKKVLEDSAGSREKQHQVLGLETEMAKVRAKVGAMERELGRVEGLIGAEERIIRKERELAASEDNKMIRLKDVEDLYNEISALGLIDKIIERVREFIRERKQVAHTGAIQDAERRLSELNTEKGRHAEELRVVESEDKALRDKYEALKKEIDADKDSGRDAEKAVFRIMSEQNELESKKRLLESEEARLRAEEEEFKRELEEAGHLVGTEVLKYREAESDASLKKSRDEQAERKREIQRLKIRLEDSGISGSGEVEKEYKDTSERDQFLMKELEDLEKSAKSLEDLIKELQKRLAAEFSAGLDKINKEFGELFSDMFGGGEARLVLVKEAGKRSDLKDLERSDFEEAGEGPLEEGLEISVSLSRKKVKGLVMLSGGERALVSIALIFAISQVNPPPFIILDETDAALDESNSRKYGDMIERLSKHSQLILITHNRETMSRAGMIYGVTMGSDGVSKLLSIEFDEAVQVAK